MKVYGKVTRLLDYHEKLADRHYFFGGCWCDADRHDPEDDRTSVEISQQDWLDLGKPESITVTIEPGDLLNNE